MTKNLWNAAKAVLRGKLIAIKSYHKKQEKACEDRKHIAIVGRNNTRVGQMESPR